MRLMKRNNGHWLMIWVLGWLIFWLDAAAAPTTETVRLQIGLRHSDGAAAVGETVILQRLPEEEPVAPECETDAYGICVWTVSRGLYQVLFARPLDDLSAQAVAEGGLRGLGITVGDEAITYYFTFHSDGHVYFDAAPEAAAPVPIIPAAGALHHDVIPTPILPTVTVEQVAIIANVSLTPTPPVAEKAKASNPWRAVLFIGGGLVIGSGLHLWTRQRRLASPTTRRRNEQPADQPTAEETNDA